MFAGIECLGAPSMPVRCAFRSICSQVLNEDLPIPAGQEYSDDFRDFVTQCMQKNPFQRPSAEQLLSHPWVTKVSVCVCVRVWGL